MSTNPCNHHFRESCFFKITISSCFFLSVWIWNGSQENWCWNKFKARHLKGFHPPPPASPLVRPTHWPWNKAWPPMFHTTRHRGDHIFGIHPNSPSPLVGSATCFLYVFLALQMPWLHDLAADNHPQACLLVSGPTSSVYLSSYLFNSASCPDHCNICYVLLRHPLGQSQLPRDPLPQFPAHVTQDPVAAVIEFTRHGDGVLPTWATKSWNSSGRIHERG